MPSFDDVVAGQVALASHVQQVIDALSARRNTPLALTVNDPLSYAFTLKNTDASSRVVQIYAADGTTVLFQVDSAGVRVSRDGTAAVSPIVSLGPGPSPQAAAGDHVHGSAGYSGTGTITLENLYTGTWVTTAANYGAGGSFGANILYVFCTAGVTVTLPAAGSTARPITVVAISGSATVASAGGSVIGGSINTSTGAVMNGVVSPGDAMTYKSDGTNWRGV
jgi:hypothetical protein